MIPVLLVQQTRFYILFGGKLYKQPQLLKDNRLMHLLCELHMNAYFPWQVIIFKTVNVQFVMLIPQYIDCYCNNYVAIFPAIMQ